MSQNLVLCFDGTNNKFGPNNTNVIRLIQAVDRSNQKIYYDAGIGTLPDPRPFTRFGKRVSEWIGLGFGVGLPSKVQAAYRYLMDHWAPESRVFIFGFSRGAYTARVLAAMLHAIGLLPAGNHSLVNYAYQLFQSSRGGSDAPRDNNYWRLTNGFRRTFARETKASLNQFPVHFLGVWDTVSSIGWVWEPKTFPYTSSLPNVEIARHAVALDERRAFYRKNGLSQVELTSGRNWQETWFPGVHSDVGGGYPEREGALWLPPFDWIVHEAEQAGLIIDPIQLKAVRNHSGPVPPRPWAEPAHDSLTVGWKPVEYIPKRHWIDAEQRYAYQANRSRARGIRAGERIGEAALRRVRDTDYRPEQFSAAFIEKIRSQNPVPPWLPFEP